MVPAAARSDHFRKCQRPCPATHSHPPESALKERHDHHRCTHQHRRTTPATTGGGVWSVTEPSRPSDGPPEGTATDRGDWWSRSPWIIAGEWVDRYFGCLSLTLELTRHVALSWTEPVRWPSGATREQPDTDGAAMPEPRPTVTGGAASRGATRSGRPRVIRSHEPGGPGRDAPPNSRTGTSPPPGRAIGCPSGQGPAPGFVDGLIGHLMDRDITGSIGIDR